MLKKLLSYLPTLTGFKKSAPDLPQEISHGEKIVRSIFSPMNLSKDLSRLKSNAFKPPADSEDLSVMRLDYTTPDFCKSFSKKIENPSSDRSYFGLALLYDYQIKETGANIVYTPIKDNPFHSDIKIGFRVKRGEPLPAEITQRVDKLTKQARLFADPNPNSKEWTGKSIE